MSLLLLDPRIFSSGYHYRVPALISSGRRRKRTLSCISRPTPSSNIKSSTPRHSLSNDVLQSLLLVTVACFLAIFDGHAMAAAMSQHSKSGYSCANVSHYYEGVDGLEGEQLRKKVFKIIRNHHIIPYGQVWDALKLLDAADSDNPEASFDVIAIYSQKAVSKRLAGKPDGWNREHLWPRSYGLIRGRPEFNDLHNLRPADVNVNSARGNKYYGECTQTSNKICAVPANQEAALDTATDRKIWMPPLKVRGDIARSLMYMAVRYGTSEVDGEFHLQLSDTPNAGLACSLDLSIRRIGILV